MIFVWIWHIYRYFTFMEFDHTLQLTKITIWPLFYFLAKNNARLMCWLINHLRFTKPPMARKLIIVKILQALVKYLLLTDFHNLKLRKYWMKNNITSALEILPEVANVKTVSLLKDNMLYQGDKQHASITHNYNLSLGLPAGFPKDWRLAIFGGFLRLKIWRSKF